MPAGVGDRLSNMTLAGSGFADDQGIGPLGDELERVQLEAGVARQLGVETPMARALFAEKQRTYQLVLLKQRAK